MTSENVDDRAALPSARGVETVNPAVRTAHRAGYRADVDGLRAVAVALVILFHLFKNVFPNGYIGVDVFFVISGFVVTSSLMRAGSGSAAREVVAFWRRRFTRIYPALAVCVLVTLVLTLLFLPPFPFEQYGGTIRSGLSALLGLANLYLFRSRQNYFTSDQSNNPFMHLWSLGVEEQFYVLFSLSFIALPLMAAPRFGAHRETAVRALRVSIVLAMTIASVGFMLRTKDPVAAYYFIQNRFWELGVGSLVAQLIGRTAVLPKGVQQVLSLCALLAIVAIAAAPKIPDVRVAFALATAATTVVILANAPTRAGSRTAAASLLSYEPVRQAGLLSYSLYLWHWPIIVLFGLTLTLHEPGHVPFAIAGFSLLAFLSYRYVEIPLRSNGASFSRRVVPAVVAVMVAAIALGVGAQLRPGILFTGSHEAWTSDWLPDRDYAYVKPNRLRAADCDRSNGTIPAQVPEPCKTAGFDAPTRGPAVLLIGDSMSFANWGMLARGTELGAFEWASVSADGCNINSTDISSTCSGYWATMDERLRRSVRKGDFVFLAPLWSIHADADYSVAVGKIDRLAAMADQLGAHAIVQAPLPQFERDAFFCTREWFRAHYDGCTVGRADFLAARSPVMTALSALRSRHPSLLIWDPIDQLCDARVCSQIDRDGHPTFRNWDHLSNWGARTLGPSFVAFLRAQMGRPPHRA